MPIRRHALHRHTGAVDLLAVWISVPDLRLQASQQRYEHLGTDGPTALVRYTDLGTHEGFVADLVLDLDGFVLDYPGLARRADSGASGRSE